MSLREHVICDSDLHVMEPPDLWERYIDRSYTHAAPKGLSEIPRDMRVKVKNHVMLRMGTVRAMHVEGRKTGWREEHDNVYAASEAAGWDAASQVAAMDAEGLDLAVLYPSRGLFVLGLDSTEQVGADGLEPEYATAIARAYNDWMRDFCDVAPDRMYGAGMVAPYDVAGAVVDARRCVEEGALRAEGAKEEDRCGRQLNHKWPERMIPAICAYGCQLFTLRQLLAANASSLPGASACLAR